VRQRCGLMSNYFDHTCFSSVFCFSFGDGGVMTGFTEPINLVAIRRCEYRAL